MKKIVLCALAALTAASVSAFDFGALVTNDSNLVGNKMSTLKLDQTNVASAWLKIPFGENAYFSTEGMYRFEKKWFDIFNVEDVKKDADDESAFDLSLAKFYTSSNTNGCVISLSLGRFATADATGVIYSQTGDGISVSYATPTLSLSCYGAYTGLLNTRTVAILNETGSADEDPAKKYDLAKKYAVGALTASLPGIIGDQTFTVQAFGAFRLEDDSFNRMYATAAFNGPILPTVFYTLSSTLGVRQFDGDTGLSNLSKATIVCYANVNALAFTMHGVYASGKQGPFKAFEGFSSGSAVRALSGRTEYTGLLRAGAAFSVKPVKQVLLTGGADAVFDAQESSIKYEGFQWQGGVNWQVLSDVALSFSASQYTDKNDAARNKSSIDVYAAISF